MVFTSLWVRGQHVFIQVESIPAAYPLGCLLDSIRFWSLRRQATNHKIIDYLEELFHVQFIEETNAFNTSITDSNIQELYIKSSETVQNSN